MEVGRRVVDVSFFFKALQAIGDHGPMDCKLSYLSIIGEVKVGLDSKLIMKCSMCSMKFTVCLIEKKEDRMEVNHQIVSGIISSGGSYHQLKTLTAAVALPIMSPSLYNEINNTVCDWWEKTAAHSMAEAVKEEAEYAVSIGSVDKNGTPLISVAVDGCWSKRSYGKNFSALSGAAAIIGIKTNKVLFFGVKNKYCVVCARAAKNDSQPSEHRCFKNYSGSSTGMESTIIVEGFKRSIVDHGVIYNKFVADGDSSTYKKILDSRPYGNLTVEKIECKNHLLRNYCNSLEKLSKDTKYPCELRKFLKERYLRLRTGVKCAIKYWGDQNQSLEEKIKNLSEDILNGPQHVFGNHQYCKEYFCRPDTRRIEPVGLLPAIVGCGLMDAVHILSKRLSYHSRSLIHNCTSNIVESFNAVIAKLVGGKRVNYSSRGSYAGRCAAAVVSFNTGSIHSKTHEVIFKSSPNPLIAKVENCNRRIRLIAKPKLRLKKSHSAVSKDAHYGPNCEKPDLSPELYEKAKSSFLADLKLSCAEREELERSTHLQRSSSEWMSTRRKLLTSSSFGEVCKKRESTSCAVLVRKIVYGSNISSLPAVRYGIENEETAIKQLEIQENISIQGCGLFVDDQYEFLGTTPDGIYANGLIEIKCPHSLAGMTLDEAMAKHTFWVKDKASKGYVINKNHNWYFQIQGQVHITKRNVCMLGIWFGATVPMKVYIIEKDDKFWEEKMEMKLVRFYYDCLLPELVDPRQSRSMPIRDAPSIIEAMKERKERALRVMKEKNA